MKLMVLAVTLLVGLSLLLVSLLSAQATAATIKFTSSRYPFILANPACPWEDFSNHTISRRNVPVENYVHVDSSFLRGSRPSIVHSPSCIRVVEGHTLRLTCQADGQPPPVTTWWRRDNRVLSGRRHTVTNSTLVIRHVTAEDSGYYWCYSINSFGKVGNQFQVKIIEVTEFCGKRVSYPSDRSTRVIGGNPILNAQTWPWMARLDSLDRHWRKTLCGAVLIHPMWVLTAAHCVVHVIRRPWSMQVRVGLYDVDDDLGTCQLFTVASVHTHNQFYFHSDYDVALLRLSRPVTLSESVSPACLPTVGMTLPASGTFCHVLGWGYDAHFIPSRVLVDGRVILRSSNYCKNHFDDLYSERLTCTDGGDDACYGDSGGPLLSYDSGRWVVNGIVHGGRTCSNGTLYVNVHAVLSWIIEKMIDINRYSVPNKLASTTCPITEMPPTTKSPPTTKLPPITKQLVATSPSPTPSCSLSQYHLYYHLVIIPLFVIILFA